MNLLDGDTLCWHENGQRCLLLHIYQLNNPRLPGFLRSCLSTVLLMFYKKTKTKKEKLYLFSYNISIYMVWSTLLLSYLAKKEKSSTSLTLWSYFPSGIINFKRASLKKKKKLFRAYLYDIFIILLVILLFQFHPRFFYSLSFSSLPSSYIRN